MTRISLAIALVVPLLNCGTVLWGQEVYDIFQNGLVQERAEGDPMRAIELYQQVVAKAADNPELAAKALIQLAGCHEKLGQEHEQAAKKAYERVVRDFSQSTVADLARERLKTFEESNVIVRVVTTHTGYPSRDANYLTFVNWETGDLAIHELRTGKSRNLTQKGSWADNPHEFAETSKISPDGTQVAYAWKNENALFHGLSGGFSIRFLPVNEADVAPRIFNRDKDVVYLRVNAWSPDGRQVLVEITRKDQSHQIGLISASDGSLRALKSLGQRDPGWMCFSPDGSHIVYGVSTADGQVERDIFVLDVGSLTETCLVKHSAHDEVLGWAPDGKHILFVSDRSGSWDAWAIRVSNGEAQGSPVLIKRQIGPVSPRGFTRNGDCLYIVSTPNYNIYSVALNPQNGTLMGPAKMIVESFMGRNQAPDWSPDGQRLAYVSRRDAHASQFHSPWTLVIRTMSTGLEQTFPLALTNNSKWLRPGWSPDGNFLLARGRDANGVWGLDKIDVRSGNTHRIVDIPEPTGEPAWSRDGQSVFYARYDASKQSRLFLKRDLNTASETVLWRQTPEEKVDDGFFRGIEISPDGQQALLFFNNHLRTLPTAGESPRHLFTAERDGRGQITSAFWSLDGHHVLFSRNGHLWRIKAEGGEPEHLGGGLDDSGLQMFPLQEHRSLETRRRQHDRPLWQ